MLTPRRRLTIRLFAAGAVGIVGLPVLLPLLGFRVACGHWARALGWPVPRRRGVWVHVWWWYGYHLGLYRLDWRMKRRALPRLVVTEAEATADPDDWFAERWDLRLRLEVRP